MGKSPVTEEKWQIRIHRKACVARAQRAGGVCSQQTWRGSQGLEAECWGSSEMMAPLNRGTLVRKGGKGLWEGGGGQV